MANKPIDNLIAAESIEATDLFVLKKPAGSRKLQGQVLLNWLTAAADGHGGIKSIDLLSTAGLVKTYRITLADNTTFDLPVSDGRGVDSVTKTGTEGLVDTYTIAYSDGTSGTFRLTNGAKGDPGADANVWIKFASQQPTESSHTMGDIPDEWIGISAGHDASAPADWTKYTWYKYKGEKGDTGAPASVQSRSVGYQVSASGTIIPDGDWSASVPVVPQGRYLWTRTTVQFNSGEPVVSYSVARFGMDGSGTVVSVCGNDPDSDGNVDLTAGDVGALPTTGGAMTGEIAMNGQPISGLNDPTENDQAARKKYVDKAIQTAAPKNLLDNSDFRNPVNQRGVQATSAIGYWLDRWKVASPGYLEIKPGAIGLNAVSNTICGLYQVLPNPDLLSGKTITLAACARSDTAGKLRFSVPYVQEIANVQVNSDWGVYTFSAVFTPNQENSIGIFAENGTTIEVQWVALYEGAYTVETLPLYQSKGYGAELTECRRYYRANEFLSCVKTNGNYFSVSRSIEMRAIPNVEFIAFSPYGASNVEDFSGCAIEIKQIAPGVQRIAYVSLPTCSAHAAGGLAVNLVSDL